MEGARGTSTAFALAGLGGFNAHGAGFLAAASDCGVVQILVTATSGRSSSLPAGCRATILRSC